MRYAWLLVLTAGCTVKDPLYCATDSDCEADRPYCDLTGTTPAAEGHANTCVPYPWDASVPELCDGVDNDRDDAIDEDWPELDASCSVGMGACERTGTFVCTAAQDSLECSEVPGTPAAQETCNDGIDDDCNGTADDGCPATPVARFPWNGYMTGSMRATETVAGIKPTRPKFMWDAAANAGTYELQIDDTCTTPGFATCAFSTPEVEYSTTFTSHQLSSELAVSSAVPVGRRYYWRVRACNELACSPWSPTRYLDVGRLHDDFNGDGYSDIVAAAPFQTDDTFVGAGKVYFFFGGSSGVPVAPSTEYSFEFAETNCRLGYAVASLGDLNADGFADVGLGFPYCDESMTITDIGGAMVLYGSAAPFGEFAFETLQYFPMQAGERFGSSLAGAGDLDGDGFHDLAVGSPRHEEGATNEGAVFLYFGSAAGVEADEYLVIDNPANQAFGEFGWSVSLAGDTNGDGLADLLVGAPFQFDDADAEGHAFAYLGRADRDFVLPDLTLDNPDDDSGAWFGYSVAIIGDMTGDGFADWSIGSPKQRLAGEQQGAVFLYPGGVDLETVDFVRLLDPDYVPYFGQLVTGAGDRNGDGLADLLAGAPQKNDPITRTGAVLVYFGTSSALPTDENWYRENPLPGAGDERFGTDCGAGDFNGDGYGDIAVGAPQGTNPEVDEGMVFVFHGDSGGGNLVFSTTLDCPGDTPYGQFGFAVD